ncbi:MAG: preprotein translocase subunit SecA, partial [Candidatus Gracilibacteria bacterium]|nr:preprotein translocase subunit SecA [Candidatus Gracilibacteria bacterium]
MLEKIIKSIFGDEDKKKINNYRKDVENINKKIKDFSYFNIDDVQNKTNELKTRFIGLNFEEIEGSKKIKEILNEIKIEAFANVVKACHNIKGKTFILKNGEDFLWDMIPYDVQLIGALGIHEGNISEMKTGEGKTLVATLTAYLNALTGNPIHIVTVNDYLAKRDSEEMGILYKTLGMSVGLIMSDKNDIDKKEDYNKNIVYITNNELGFDYLRNNMVVKKEDKLQSKLFYAIIDEIDSILIDEARTPLIISSPENEATDKYEQFSLIVKKLEKGVHFKVNEKDRNISLNAEGIKYLEKIFNIENIYISTHFNKIHHIENSLKAHFIFKKDKDYLVVDNEVSIIDEHTGRTLKGRRYGSGLHQAI